MRALLVRLLHLAIGFSIALAGCDSCDQGTDTTAEEQGEKKEAMEAADGEPSDARPKAVLEGVIRLAPGAEVPSYSHEQMQAKVLGHSENPAPPERCTPPKIVDRQPARLSGEGGLSGIVVAASQFKRGRGRKPTVQEVEIEDCRLQPPVVLAMKGDTVRVSNRDDYVFMPSFGTDGMARTLTQGQHLDFPAEKHGVFPLRCGFTAPCGRSDVVVMMHPIGQVSDEQGRFRLEDVPADEDFVISAWHPLFKEAKKDVRVAAGETKQIELIVEPR